MAQETLDQLGKIVGPKPLNPFVDAIKSELNSQTGGNLSPLQKKIVQFVESEARGTRSNKIQPPTIDLSTEAYEKARQEKSSKEQEFFKRYGLTEEENKAITEIIFYGTYRKDFVIDGHSFGFRDVPDKTRRKMSEIARRVKTRKAAAFIKINVVAETWVELDGIELNSEFLRGMLARMQDRFVDLLYLLHLSTEDAKISLYEKLPNFCRTPQSQIRFSVLNYHGSFVTDPLFQKLTEEQIYWHYINIMKDKEIDNKIVDSKLEYLSWFINSDMAKKVQQRKEMHKEADVNVSQKFSFMNGILDMIRGDMTDEQATKTMDELMQKMKEQESEDFDPWSAEEDAPTAGDVRSLTNASFKQPEGKVGMVGGDPSWHNPSES